MAAPTKTSLFIGDLAIFCTERDVDQLFSQYGEIQEIKIMKSEETSRNLSYGFLKFTNTMSAKRAMNELNGFILCGRPLRYDLFQRNFENGESFSH
jgi:RNA recognition motif-containing protein